MAPISHDSRENGSSYPNGNGVSNGSSTHANGNGVTATGPEPMAIIGMACKFPQEAEDPEKFWKLMLEGRSAMTEFPKEKLNIDAHYHPDPAHGSSMSNRGGHFLKNNGAAFDAQFFTLTKVEVMSMDPQQRILMENVYLALENAGIQMDQATSSKTSVFVGAFTNDYQKSILGKDPDVTLKYMPTGTSNSILANRVSWFYDFKGTSVTLDTACSSSLVAFHLACQDLQDKRAEMAVVSGVNVIEDPELFYRMSALGFLSPDSRCYSFDHRANGYSRGEGVGTVIIKPLSAALRDGNTIRAIVRGTGVNSDGRTPGITMPSKAAQESLIRAVYTNAGLNLEDTGFVEAHGTGTPAGDPLEAGAIAMAWRDRKSETPLYIGALKSNVGHMEGASGVAGLIKSVMILEKGIIPPNIHFEKVNPKIPTKDWNIDFPLAPMAWPSAGLRRISVNSFGFGGTNAHAVLDDAYHYLETHNIKGIHRTITSSPTLESNGSEKSTDAPRKRVFVWSSSDETGTKRLCNSYKEFFESKELTTSEDEYLDDLAYTLSKKRTVFPYRTYVQAASVAELVTNLSAEAGALKPLRSKALTNLGFVFTGQGAQWALMGKELLQYPVFKQSLDDADAYIKSLNSPWGLLDEFHKDAKESNINHPTVSQTMCTVLQVALVDLLATWNIAPARVIGHSSGEIAAAYAAGAISRESAWKVAYYRGVVSATQTEKKGAMMAVGTTEDRLLPYMEKVNKDIEGELVIACHNSPKSFTVSGDEVKIDALKAALDADEIFARKLKVMNAYHSGHMKAVADEYLRLIGDISITHSIEELKAHPPTKKPAMYSSVTGKLISSHELSTGQYWVDNMISQVRFAQALVEMCTPDVSQTRRRIGKGGDAPVQLLLEVGPHPALQSACNDTLAAEQLPTPYSYVLNRNSDAIKSTLDTVGKLFCLGCPVDLHAVNHSSFYPAGTDPRPAKMSIDLPGYAFNHSQTYWPESRYSKAFRFRKNPRHDLLGSTVTDWNPAEPKWRHMIRLSENPWLRDHEITGSVVYPGVGYIIMAIEAVKQLAENKSEILGVRLRDISIKTALQVPDVEDGVETMISMRAVTESSLSASNTWREFWISSYSPEGDSWTEHCRGKIALEYKVDTGPIDAGREAVGQQEMFEELLTQTRDNCKNPVDMTSLYADLETIGLTFGPLFKNLSQAQYAGGNQGEAIARVTIPDVASSMPMNYLEPHIIHPATMDSMLHMFLAAFQDLTGGAKIIEPLLPVFMQEVWVSASIGNKPGETFTAHGSVRRVSHKKLQAAITVWDNDGVGRVTVRGMQAVPLQDSAAATTGDRSLCFNIDWKPDVDLLDSQPGHAYFEKALEQNPADENEILRMTKELQLATIIYVRDCIKGIEANPPEGGLLWYHEKYLNVLRHWWSEYENGKILHQSPEWKTIMEDDEATEKFLARMATETLDGKLLYRLGPKMVPVLRQEADAIELMFGDDILEVYYRETIGTARIQSQLKSYLQSVGHKFTNLKVLEIGAGTGGTSTSVLQALCPVENGSTDSKTSSLASYTYTDISAGFFEAAKEKFKSWKHLMTFKTLNIENSPVEQGFELGDYDIIVAANVLHATPDLNSTLANVRSLLRPDGKLILVEGTQPEMIRGPMCFGLLPGWWLSIEPERQLGPLLPKLGWDNILKNHAFNGTELFLQDNKDPGIHFQSLIISSAVEEHPDLEKLNRETLVVVSPSNRSQVIGDIVLSSLKDLGLSKISTVPYTDLATRNLREAICVVLPELFDSVLINMSEDTMSNIRHMLTTAAGIIWVTKDAIVNPEMAMINGIIRTLRWERDLDESNLITLSFENGTPETTITSKITQIFQYQFLHQQDQRHAEYVYKDQLIHINRLYYSQRVNTFLNQKTAKPSAQQKPFGEDPSRALSLSIRNPGLLDSLEFVDDAKFPTPLGDRELEVQIKATGLNFRDVMVAMSEVDDVALGLEASGVVTRVGSDNPQNFQVGDRVMILSTLTGCFQTYARTTQDLAVKIPDHMSFEAAAAIPVTFSTAYYCLVDIARLGKGESILIHAAAGGVGQAAIMLAQSLGAVIYVTVSSEEKKSLVMEKYGIPAENIFSSRGLSFAQGIMRVTKGRGVDVVLNSLSGEALRRSWDCIAPFGRFVEIGKKDVYSNGKLDMFSFSKSATFAAVDLNLVIHLDPKTGGRLLRESLKLWEENTVKLTSPLNVFGYGQIEEAFRLMQAGKHIGKVVLKANAEDIVPVVPAMEPPYMFRSDASYILPGGLGGIGRSTSRWMVSRGARSLIFINRSATWNESTRQAVNELLAELKQKGCTATVFEGDISNREMLEKIIQECKDTLPPIKGCIHGAMQLKDSAFENMTLENFNAALLPKVQGSWNLHDLLPKDMDFFVMLSSVAGVLGNRGQSNYAAGNNYQDALAYHRRSLGLPGYSLDLGNILSVGFIAENKNLFQGNMTAITQEGVREDELLSVFEYHVNPGHLSSSPVDSQVSIGLVTADTFKRKGMPIPSFLSTPLFTHLRSESNTNTSALDDDSGGPSIQSLLSTAPSLDHAAGFVVEAIVKRLSTTLAIPAGDIDPGKPIHFYGVDSLVAMEFRSWFAKSMACDIPVLDIMGNASISVLSRRIAGLSKHVSAEAKGEGEGEGKE
ncbi:hypothetical protein F5884DRAFT_683224 [Xylogone sp. PMI_703]|nr:hypothetical protein F5884DRAFT_683224 [Xylogone sp. PMI_703]